MSACDVHFVISWASFGESVVKLLGHQEKYKENMILVD